MTIDVSVIKGIRYRINQRPAGDKKLNTTAIGVQGFLGFLAVEAKSNLGSFFCTLPFIHALFPGGMLRRLHCLQS